MNTPAERVAVIVLSHNKCRDTLECLGSVGRLAFEAYDLVVVDNGSDDGSPDAVAAAFPHAEIIAVLATDTACSTHLWATLVQPLGNGISGERGIWSSWELR